MTLASPFWGQIECGQDYVYKTLGKWSNNKTTPVTNKKRATEVDRNPTDNVESSKFPAV